MGYFVSFRMKKMEKMVFVGDIHGKIEVIDFVEKKFPNHQKIFVGDLVDAFDRTRKQQLACVQKVLSMVDKGDTRVILGNHELSYLTKEMKCSGYAGVMDALLLPLKSEMWKKYERYIWMPEHKLLVTHAGLSNYFWREYGLTFENLGEKLEEWKRQQWRISPYGWVGIARGGVERIGGPFWCDFNEEFNPIPDLRQVFGHTGWIDESKDSKLGIREKGWDNYCIDCLQRVPEFLEFDPNREVNQFKILTFSNMEVFGHPNIDDEEFRNVADD